jgi:hypothetical protein
MNILIHTATLLAGTVTGGHRVSVTQARQSVLRLQLENRSMNFYEL